MNKVEQDKYDTALISMPLCLASSAYSDNPYYHNYRSLVAWGKERVALFRRREFGPETYISNNVDCRLVEEWIHLLECRYSEKGG